MKRTHTKLFIALLAALLLAAGCGDDADETPAVEYKVLGGRLVWCSGGAEDMVVPGNASSIGNNAFSNYDTIRTLTIPATVTHIMSGTFSRVKVETIYFGGTYDEWDAMVDGFGFTLDGTPVKCADGKTWIWTAPAEPDVPVKPDEPWEITADGIFVRYTGDAAHVTIPDGVTGIGADAFAGCESLTDIDIPASVTAIAPGAFAGSGITEIEYKGDSSAWNELVEAGGIADELDGITVNCADGTWTPAHVHTWGKYTDDENGGHYRTCSECGALKTEKHDCDVADNGDGTHTVSCTKCDYADRAEHRYEDDTCAVCGCPNPTTVYVASTGSDTNGNGSKSKPLATIQKAVDAVIARNDGASAYTIYVAGTLTQSEAPVGNGMADFSALGKNLTLTIQSLSCTATLDAGGKSRVIYAKPASGTLNLTLENLVITGGTSASGGAAFLIGGSVTMHYVNITQASSSAVSASGISVASGATLSLKNVSITGMKTTGGAVVVDGTLNILGGVNITGNTTADGAPKNVYLPSGKTLHVQQGSLEGTQIGVSTQEDPAAAPVPITSGYGAAGYRNAQLSSYFTSDAGFALKLESGEAALAASGGSIGIVVPKEITFSLDATSGNGSAITVSAFADGDPLDFAGFTTFAGEVWFGSVPTGRRFTTNSFSLDSSWDGGTYIIKITAIYGGTAFNGELYYTKTP